MGTAPRPVESAAKAGRSVTARLLQSDADENLVEGLEILYVADQIDPAWPGPQKFGVGVEAIESGRNLGEGEPDVRFWQGYNDAESAKGVDKDAAR